MRIEIITEQPGGAPIAVSCLLGACTFAELVRFGRVATAILGESPDLAAAWAWGRCTISLHAWRPATHSPRFFVEVGK